MKTIVIILLIALSSFSAHGASWELYFENKLGNRFYIDKESIHKTPEGTILVWRKITSEKAEKNVTLEVLYEIDCSCRRYKTLQGTVYGGEKGIEPLEKTNGEYFEPSDLSKALFKAICK